jgi:hypothetical protein
MKTELIVEPRKNYGETRIYPKCDMSKGFAALLGQSTLTPANIQGIIRLGFTIRAEYTEPKEELTMLGIQP